MPIHNKGRQHTERGGWFRAMVLGANDGVLSTANLLFAVI
jgi:VIT1/CCC1 family predicted Fe2+/Mn2+ transporter